MTIQALIAHLESFDASASALPVLEALLKSLKPRKARVSSDPDRYAIRDTSTMSDADVTAYYRARVEFDDCQFHAAHGEPSLRTDWLILADDISNAPKATAEHRGRIVSLRRAARALELNRYMADCRQRADVEAING